MTLLVEEKAEGNWKVEWRAPDLGREIAVDCPRCGRFIGNVHEQGETEIVCETCQVQFHACVENEEPKLEAQKGKVLIQSRRDPDMPTLGQAVRGEIPPLERNDWKHVLLNVLLIVVLFILAVLATKYR